MTIFFYGLNRERQVEKVIDQSPINDVENGDRQPFNSNFNKK